jgi:hypothetical protein
VDAEAENLRQKGFATPPSSDSTTVLEGVTMGAKINVKGVENCIDRMRKAWLPVINGIRPATLFDSSTATAPESPPQQVWCCIGGN